MLGIKKKSKIFFSRKNFRNLFKVSKSPIDQGDLLLLKFSLAIISTGINSLFFGRDV